MTAETLGMALWLVVWGVGAVILSGEILRAWGKG